MRKLIFTVAALLFLIGAGFPILGTTDEISAETDEIVYVLDDCDSTTQYLVSRYPDTTNYVQGTGSWYANNEAGRITARFLDLDTSLLPAFEEAYLEFYYYVYDATNINAGQIELSSSGYEDVEELSFDVTPKTMTLENGWNFVSVKLTDFKNDGSFDYSRLSYFRFFMAPLNSGSFEANLDYLVLTNRCHLDEVAENGFTPMSTPWKKLDQVVSERVYRGEEGGMTPLSAWAIVLPVLGILALAAGLVVTFKVKI